MCRILKSSVHQTPINKGRNQCGFQMCLLDFVFWQGIAKRVFQDQVSENGFANRVFERGFGGPELKQLND